MCLEITADGRIIVRAPLWVRKSAILHFVANREEWIRDSLYKMEKKKAELEAIPSISDEQLALIKSKAKEVIPERVEVYAQIMGLSYGRITIKCQQTLWGSCSVKHNLNFNCLLLLVPPQVMDYVIVHELCHIIELNHSARFWAEVSKVMPDYKIHRKWLKENGSRIIASVNKS